MEQPASGPLKDWAYPLVLHLIGSLAIGGTERQLVEFIRRSSVPENHRVAVFDEPGALAGLVPHEPIVIGQIRRQLRKMPSNIQCAWTLRGVVRDLGVNLVHAHLGFSEVLATVAPRRVPLVASRRGRNIGFEGKGYLRLIEGFAHRRTSQMICNSEYLARYTRGSDLWPPPIKVIYNGIDLERFQPVPMPQAGPPTIAVVANLRAYKGHERFLRAFRGLRQMVPGAKALLVGDGPDRERLLALSSILGLEDDVTFVGQVGDPRPFIARSHILVLASSHEGFPNAILEAMAMGRPVVATRVGGVPELVRHGVDGLLTSLDPHSLATAMVTLLKDERLRTQMGVEARGHAESFDWGRVVRDTEAVYERVTQRRSRASVGQDRNRSRVSDL
jgi:glycosyltransferase involved in cell wall biosynthesis